MFILLVLIFYRSHVGSRFGVRDLCVCVINHTDKAKFIVELMHRDSIATSEPWSLFWLWFTRTMMIAMGWVLVPFNFGPTNLWFDDDHPRSRYVVRYLISFIRIQMKQGVINRGEHIALLEIPPLLSLLIGKVNRHFATCRK